MGKGRPSAKGGTKNRNDNRPNGKADKTRTGRSRHAKGSLSAVERILMGKGLYAKWPAVVKGKARGL